MGAREGWRVKSRQPANTFAPDGRSATRVRLREPSGSSLPERERGWG